MDLHLHDDMSAADTRLHSAASVGPNFLVIGAEKCGTTFLHQALAGHADVFMPEAEIPFFQDPDYVAPHALEKFRAIFAPGSGKRAVGLKRPNYLHRTECAPRIYEHCRDAKLIVILRDPVERAISAYYHYVLNRFLPLRRADAGLTAVFSGEYAVRYPRSREVIDGGFYHAHLTRYLALFPKQQILTLVFEDLCTDPAAAWRRVCAFLEIDANDAAPLPPGRVNAGVYSLPRLALLRQRSRIMFRYNAERTRLWQREPIGTTAERAARYITRIDGRLARVPGLTGRGVVDGEVKRSLAAHYIDDTLSLEKLLGRDLSHWYTKRALA